MQSNPADIQDNITKIITAMYAGIGIGKYNFPPYVIGGIDENGVPYYGTLPNGVKIYKGDASITDDQMTTAVQNVIEGYNSVRPEFGSPVGKFTKVLVISDKAYSWDGSVLGLRFDLTSVQCSNRFEKIAEGNLDKTTN